LLKTLPHKLKQDVENDVYREYVTSCLRIITENTAGMVNGTYMTIDFNDLINPKPVEKYEQGEITERIRNKLG
jgi:hypothetical protein